MSDQHYRQTCTFPGCNIPAHHKGIRCTRHRNREIKEGTRVMQKVRSIPVNSSDRLQTMDISLPAEPWEANQ